MRPRVLSFLCVLWMLPLLNAQTTLDQVFAKIDETAKGFHSIECSLEQTHVTLLVDDKDTQFGQLYYTRAGKEPRLKVEIIKPGKKSLLVDKGKFWLYTPSIKQVQEGSLGSHASTVDELMSVGFGQSSADLKKNFKVSMAGEEVIDGKKTAILDLMPISPGGVVKTLRMWVDQKQGISLQIKATENTGDYTIYKYSNIKLINSALPDKTFELNMPKDVHVSKIS